MSYLTTNIGPSPFLTSSQHHYHTGIISSSIYHPHYATNSYTNTSHYLQSYQHNCRNKGNYQKYFPRELIKVLPGISNLSRTQEQKLIHPLNACSGSSSSVHNFHSPYHRGEIYYGNKDSYPSTSSSGSTIIHSLKQGYNETDKMENPFHKKYLLTKKNKQLEDYALYSTYGSGQYQAYQKYSEGNYKNYKKSGGNKQQVMNAEQMGEGMLRLAKKYGNQISKQSEGYDPQNYINVQNQSDNDRKYENLVESEVDQKQFDSFGQGKNKITQRGSLKHFKNQNGESLINDLVKVMSNESQRVKVKDLRKSNPNITIQSRRQPAFIDSDDDEKRSGTFKVPDSIIDEINNPRIPSTMVRRGKDQTTMINSQKQKVKYSRQQSVQVGARSNPPTKITFKGRSYEKISI